MTGTLDPVVGDPVPSRRTARGSDATSLYTALAAEIRESGLLRRRHAYYWTRMSAGARRLSRRSGGGSPGWATPGTSCCWPARWASP